MKNNIALILLCMALTFIFGAFSGFIIYDAASINESLKAKCTSINGNYGGGKCYINGVEVVK